MMPSAGKILVVQLLYTAFFWHLGVCNLYNPHLYPAKGPFFEGFYARLVDETHSVSFGVLFGRVLRQGSIKSSIPTTYLGLLRSQGDGIPMEVVEAYPPENTIKVTVDGGKPVTANPDTTSPAHFKWCAEPYGCFHVTPNATEWKFTIKGVTFEGSCGQAYPWGPNGEGPEGWVYHVPILPLHWFVYSLGSKVRLYSWQNQNTGLSLTGSNGVLHQEKNWGESFPGAWIWAQGVDSKSGVTLAMSLGLLDILKVSIPAHLIGYRNSKSGLRLSYLPLNSITSSTIRACEGLVNVTVYGLSNKIEINFKASTATLQKCLNGPTVKGFTPVCVESYTATAEVRVYERKFLSYKLIDTNLLRDVALEYGGDYLCSTKNPCRS